MDVPLACASKRSLLKRETYVRLTMLKASMYRSKHRVRQVSSELDSDVEGFKIHFAKHLSLVVVMSSCAFDSAISLRTLCMICCLRSAWEAPELVEDLRKSAMFVVSSSQLQ